MPVTDSPLRYPGGKTQIKGFIQELIEVNITNNATYVEPFAGGAGVALSLLYSDIVDNVIINDLDKSIYYFWVSILSYTDEFIEMISTTPISIEEWYKQHEIHKNIDNYSPLEIGFSTFFLNRTNRSGIISGGPIGGHDQKGSYKLDCRFNKTNLIRKIKKIAKYKERIEVTNLDALIFVDNVIPSLEKDRTFIFFDPPYYEQGKKLYTNFYSHNDHITLCKKIKSLNEYYWITTYDLSNEIEKIYDYKNKKIYSLTYSANKKRKAKEFLFYSQRIILPKSKHVKLYDIIL